MEKEMQWTAGKAYKLYDDQASVLKLRIALWAVDLLGIGISSISSAQEPKAVLSVSVPRLPSRAKGTHTGILEEVPQGHLLALLLRSWKSTSAPMINKPVSQESSMQLIVRRLG